MNSFPLPLFLVGFASLLVLPPICAAPQKARPVVKAWASHARQKSPVFPKPRLTVRLSDLPIRQGQKISLVAATPRTLFFEIVAGTDGLARIEALNRGTGELRWRGNTGEQFVNIRNRTIRTQWQMLGVSLPGKDGMATLIQQQMARTDVQTGDRANPWQSSTEWTLYGNSETAAANASWQYPTLTGPANTNLRGETVVGNLLLLNDGSLTPVLWNAQTGKPVDRTSLEGKALAAQAIAANGSPLVQRAGPNKYSVYRLDTGQSVPFVGDNPEESINVDPLGVTIDRALWYKNGDNGMAGHSGFASSLWCADASGKTVWVYPDRTYYTGEFLDERGNLKSSSDYARLYRDVQQAVLCGARTKEPVAVAVVRHGDKPCVDGLRLRNGKLLWSHPFLQSLSERIDLVPAGKTINGAFFVQRGQVFFLDAATGKTRTIGSLPGATTSFLIADDDIITVDAKGILRIYSVKKLLGGR